MIDGAVGPLSECCYGFKLLLQKQNDHVLDLVYLVYAENEKILKGSLTFIHYFKYTMSQTQVASDFLFHMVNMVLHM